MIKLKTEEEIEILKEGGSRHADILRELAAIVEPGLSTLILEEEALRLVRAKGGKPALLGYTPKGALRPFPATVCVSINNEIVHGIPNEGKRILNEGDIVSIDLGFSYKGYITDAAITTPVGVVDDETKKLLSTAKLALDEGIKVARGGNTIGDIGHAISEAVKPSGFSLAKGLCGHGVGYSVHEEPLVPNYGKPNSGEKLVEGLVIAIEPMVNVGKGNIRMSKDGYTISTKDGSRSAHFEHTVAITKKGNIILTS